MSIDPSARSRLGNRLLDRLSDEDYARILPHLRPMKLELGLVIYEAWKPIREVHFPTNGIVSALAVTVDGHSIEVANIGREGAAGAAAAFGLQPSIHKVIVQIAGEGLKIDLDELQRLAEPGSRFHGLLAKYFIAFLAQSSQSVLCNGLHKIKQRCCRWLLMTHDRIDGDVLPLTHEFLGIVLGVRRASVTEILNELQADGLIRGRRGNIIVEDRIGLEAACCECYATVEEDYVRMLG